MTSTSVTMILGLFGLVSALSAMSQVPGAVPGANSMDICGKSVELGMLPKAALGGFFDGSECVVYNTKENPELFAIGRGKVVVGSLRFSNGKVSKITREWAAGVETTEEFAKALVNALQEMKVYGTSQCKLRSINQTSPSSEIRGSVLTCGQRSLLFSTSNDTGQNKFEIQEVLSN